MISKRGASDTRVSSSFYAGKTVRILVNVERGVAYDLYQRLAASHMGRNIPGNPEFVVENRPQTGSKDHAQEIKRPRSL